MDDADQLVGVVVSKLEPHRGGPLRGYIAMLAVRVEWRGRGIATKLVRRALDAMIERDAEEIILEAETTNSAAMKLYERLGFLRSKRLHRYYLNGNTAYRFVLYVKTTPATLNRPLGWEPLDANVPSVTGQRVEQGAKEKAGGSDDKVAPSKTAEKKSAKAKSKSKAKGKGKGKGKT